MPHGTSQRPISLADLCPPQPRAPAPSHTPFPDPGGQLEGGSGLGRHRLWHRHWYNWFGPSLELRAGRPRPGSDSLSRYGGGSVTHGPESSTSQPREPSLIPSPTRRPCASGWAAPACPAHLSHVPGWVPETQTASCHMQARWLDSVAGVFGWPPCTSPRPSVLQLCVGGLGSGHQGSWVPSVSLGRVEGAVPRALSYRWQEGPVRPKESGAADDGSLSSEQAGRGGAPRASSPGLEEAPLTSGMDRWGPTSPGHSWALSPQKRLEFGQTPIRPGRL